MSRFVGARERGQVVVLFALLLPVFFGLGSIVLGIGNWYVHKRHLQTLVDAGALAGGTAFSGCFQNPTTTDIQIADVALEYAGDENRQPLTQNAQVQEAGDVHALLNSNRYWAQGDPTDDTSLRAPGYDNTLGKPCAMRFLDVKATDDELPLLFRWIPLFPSAKAKARVQIHKVLGLNGMLPWGVPEVDPERVAAVIVNEDLPLTDPNGVRGAGFLSAQSGQPGIWAGDLLDVGLNGNDRFNTVIVVSRDAGMSLGGSLDDICTQNPVQTVCYADGTTMSGGMSFIRVHDDPPSAGDIGEVMLADATCGNDSAPYFVLELDCRVSISRAVVNFGVAGDPTVMPTCARVSASGAGDLTWVDSGGIGHWDSATFPLDQPGRNEITLTVEERRPNGTNCNQRRTVTSRVVAAPYVADDAAGPVESLRVTYAGVPRGSVAQDSDASLSVRVGLIPPLEVADAWDDPPIYLRITSNSSQTQALDCDSGTVVGPAGSHANFRNEIEDGCFTFYTPNTRNGDCSNYGIGSLPPPTVRSNPLDDCVITQTGVTTGQIRQALDNRFGRAGGGPSTPCKTLNNWPQSASDPYPDPTTDGRYIVLFIVDQTAFQGSGNKIYPVRNFGGFYLTGGDGLNCPGDDPPPPGTRQASAWGHFLTYVTPSPDAEPDEELCEFDEVGTCIAVLVE